MVWYLCLVKGGNYPGFVAVLVRLRHIKNGKIDDTRIPVANSSKLFMLFFPFEKAALYLLNIWFLLYDSDTSYGRVSSYPLLLLSYFMFFLILFHHHQTPNRTKASNPICHTSITLNILNDLRKCSIILASYFRLPKSPKPFLLNSL